MSIPTDVTASHHPGTRQRGLIDLALRCDDGVTRPERCAVRPPLQLSRVRYDDPTRPGAAMLTMVQLGGILSGDRYAIDVALGPSAQAQITTAAATQVYRMLHGYAEQTITLDLADESVLAWLPEQLILFAQSDLRQTVQVRLGHNARLALLDVLVPGRLARGEAFEFQRYESRLEVTNREGRLLVADRALLEPKRLAVDVAGVLGSEAVVGSLWLLGAWPETPLLTAPDGLRIAATQLPNSAGQLIRAIGPSGSAVRAALMRVLPAITNT